MKALIASLAALGLVVGLLHLTAGVEVQAQPRDPAVTRKVRQIERSVYNHTWPAPDQEDSSPSPRSKTPRSRAAAAAPVCLAAERAHQDLHQRTFDVFDVAIRAYEIGPFDKDGHQDLYDRLVEIRAEAVALYATWQGACR